jgi:Tryptophan-rich Synechocystis species C-terminal domain
MATTISSSTTGPVVLGTADNPLYITSTGTVTSTGSADGIDGGTGTTWTITNAGVVSAITGNGVSLASSGIVGNTGSISGNDALVLKAGGSVTNNVGGSISGLGALGAGLGSGAGVYITGAAGTVTNNSTISGVAYGVGLGHGGLVTNTSSITGGEDGVIVQGAIGTIANTGNITATVDDGVALFAGGSVTNASGASISGQGTLGAGVFITGGVGTVTNAGSISGPNHHGVLIAGGGSLSNAASGSISALGVGVFFETNPGTVTNAGFITGTGTDGTGVYLENGGSATNTSTGTIIGHKFGAFLEGAATTLANYGSISGATYDGVVLGLGGSVTNAAGASISGLTGGVYIKYRAAGTVTNSGSISATGTGSAAIDLADGGVVTNNSTGSVSGNSFGVFITGAGGTIANAGSIASVKYGGVELAKGGSVTNSAGASITGGSIGVYVGTGGAGTVTNSGSINATSASGAGVDLAGGGSVTNNSGGSISGGGFGVFTSAVPATLSNSGSISGSHGVGLEAGGSVTNAASASITGQVDGVFAQGGVATLSNAGSIVATAGAGADLEGGGSITNLAGATISGSTFGVFLTGGSGTVTNAGTISGGTYAIDFAGSATNRLVVDPGAVFVGKVIGGSGTNTLELASGTGTIGAVGTGSFNNFQVLAVDTGATWTLSGANIAPTVLDNGTVSIAGSLDVSTAIDASSTGLFQLGSAATLEVAAATGTTAHINFQGSGSELIIDNAASFGTNVGTASYAGPQLQHFVLGDKIDLKTFSSAGVTLNYNVSTGVLQVSNSANQVASLDFQTSSLPPGTIFAATSDGATGIFITDTSPVITVIEALGSTELVQAGSNFFLDTISGGTGPELKYGGSPVVAGDFGSWTPIAGEITGSGYEVAWKLPGADQYSIWNTDSNGNEIFNTGAISGSAVDAYETSFHQDLNGDGTIGPIVMTSVVQVGSNFFLDAISSGTGPELKYGGAPVVAGEFGSWTPIAAEITGNGYEVAWKLPGANQYSIWNTDSNGNEISNTGAISGSAVETYEVSLQRDINGDGTIGPIVTVIEAFGSTELVQAGGNFFLDAITSGSGPELKYGGSPVVAGEFGSWTPIATEITGSGYEVAWKLPGTNQYSIWFTDSSGNEISNTGAILGSSNTLISLEGSFHQDLNGDGVVFTSGSGSVVGAGSLVIGAGAGVELTGAYSGAITFASASGTLTIDHSASFSGTIAGQLATGDKIDLADITAGANATIAYSGNNSPGTLTVSDGTHTASMALLGNYSLANFTASSDGHGGTSVIDPPLYQASSGFLSSGNESSIHTAAMPDFRSLDHAPPGGPAPSPYAKLAGLLDQYMAAGSGQGAAGVTSWTTSQQASLGGDKEFLTKPHG